MIDYLRDGLDHLVANFTSWDEELQAGYLAGALVIALAVLAVRQVRRGRTPRHLLALLFPRRIFLHRSSLHDVAVVAINSALLFPLVMMPLFGAEHVAAALLVAADLGGLAWVSGEAGLAERLGFTVAMLLAWDFGATFAHYMKHRVPLLWEFHKVHHSAEVLTPLTAHRRHPVDAIFGGMVISVTMGTTLGLWLLAFGDGGGPLTLLGVPAGIFLWRLLGYNLRHSHVWISYGPIGDRIFISPAQHQIHHSVDPRHHDTNFGHVLAFWDMLFGTLVVPQRGERVRFGLAPADMAECRSVGGLYFLPFRRAWRLLGRRMAVEA